MSSSDILNDKQQESIPNHNNPSTHQRSELKSFLILFLFSLLSGIFCDAFYYSIIPFILTLVALLAVSLWQAIGPISWKKTRSFFSATFDFHDNNTHQNRDTLQRLFHSGHPIITVMIVSIHVFLYLGVAVQAPPRRMEVFNTLTGYCNNTNFFCANNATCEYLYKNSRVETIFGASIMNGLPEYGGLPFHLHLIITMLLFLLGAVRFEKSFGSLPVLFIWIFAIVSIPYCFGSYIGYGSSVIAVSMNAAYLGAVYKHFYCTLSNQNRSQGSAPTAAHHDEYRWLKIVSLNWSAFLFTILSAVLVQLADTPTVGNLNHASAFLRSLFIGAITQFNFKKDRFLLLIVLVFCWCLVYGLNTMQKYFFFVNDKSVK